MTLSSDSNQINLPLQSIELKLFPINAETSGFFLRNLPDKNVMFEIVLFSYAFSLSTKSFTSGPSGIAHLPYCFL